MLMPSQSEADLNGVRPVPGPTAIRERLNRLLADPLLADSKRDPVLLAYTVKQKQLGNSSELKERTIGVEAFCRDPSCDLNLNPVVRTTAGEVRKRLIQDYYHHPGELLIELPLGSCVANFSEPDHSQATSARTLHPHGYYNVTWIETAGSNVELTVQATGNKSTTFSVRRVGVKHSEAGETTFVDHGVICLQDFHTLNGTFILSGAPNDRRWSSSDPVWPPKIARYIPYSGLHLHRYLPCIQRSTSLAGALHVS
jgi:hypothetical protein